MPDIAPRDLNLRAPEDFRTGLRQAALDTLVGVVAGAGLCQLINHPPFGQRLANPTLWVLLPLGIGLRHGELAGALAGLAAWGMHAGVFITGDWPAGTDANTGLVSAFLLTFSGAVAGYLSAGLRRLGLEEIGKQASLRAAVYQANLTLRMASRVRDDLMLELLRARRGGTAVAPLLRRVMLARPDRYRDEILEYLDTVHEVRAAAIYARNPAGAWVRAAARGAHPDGEFPARLNRGLDMAATVATTREAVFVSAPETETERPLIIAPLVVRPDGVAEILVVEDMDGERLSPRETLAVATVVEFFGLRLVAGENPDIGEYAENLLRLRRVIGIESTLVSFPETPEGRRCRDNLISRLDAPVCGVWPAANHAQVLLAPGAHPGRIHALMADLYPPPTPDIGGAPVAISPRRIAPPVRIVGFHEISDELLCADDWARRQFTEDSWEI